MLHHGTWLELQMSKCLVNRLATSVVLQPVMGQRVDLNRKMYLSAFHRERSTGLLQLKM